MDAVIFGAGFKSVLFGMSLFVAAVYLAASLVGHARGSVSADALALAGAAFGALSIGGIGWMLALELRTPHPETTHEKTL